MGTSIALVTANMGGIDPLFALPPHPGIDALYYTDVPSLGSAASTWTRILVPPYPASEPRLKAKFFKCQAHHLPEVRGYPWLAWADASFEFHSLEFLTEWSGFAAPDGSRAVFVPHPDRQTVAQEYGYVLRQIELGNPYLAGRYSAEALEREREFFSRIHDLEALKLWAGGLWLMANASRTHAFLDAWWNCVLRFSILDQAALSPLLMEHGIEPVGFDVDLSTNQHFTRHVHP